jgi:predicted TIM-barrel fold metal-dependent hydrolase
MSCPSACCSPALVVGFRDIRQFLQERDDLPDPRPWRQPAKARHARHIDAVLDYAAPDRCVWASDWPHPVSVVQPPNDADLLELLYRYAPDEAELQKILVTNPAKLFGFGD